MLSDPDRKDIIDIVQRNGSMTYSEMRRQSAVYTPDEIWDALAWARENDIVARREGNLHEDGTTEGIWEWKGYNDE